MKDRHFQVKIDETLSDKRTQRNGIPQGSVISCTIFKLAINSIVEGLPRDVRNSLFMDDFCLYISAKKLRQAERILNLVLKKLDRWTKKTGFKFSLDKTKAIIFFRDKRWLKEHVVELKLGAHIIPIVAKQKFLGIMLDKHLNFKAHTEYIKGKCRKALNLVKKLAHTSWGADRKTLKLIYKATTLAIVDYGCHIYGSATQPVLRKLDPVHNEGLRLATGAFRSSPTTSIQVESGEPPLALHRESVIMKSKLKFLQNNSPITNLFRQNDIYWKPNGQEDTAPYNIRANRLLRENEIEPEEPHLTNSPPAWKCKRANFCFNLISID